MFPRADSSIAVEWVGYQVIMLRPIEGLEFVEETVTALGYSTELAHHLFRECWSIGTGSDTDLCRAFGWEVEAHKFKVATAALLVSAMGNTVTASGPRPRLQIRAVADFLDPATRAVLRAWIDDVHAWRYEGMLEYPPTWRLAKLIKADTDRIYSEA